MKIGLAGYQGSGKSTLFEWLTEHVPDASMAHTAQTAMATVPEPRLDQLAEVYHPKKITRAHLEIVDTPGLSRDHHGNAARLATLREAGCLVLVVAAFDGSTATDELTAFEEDLLLADMEIVSSRLERIAESLKKPIPRPEREKLQHEEETLRLVLDAMEKGEPLRDEDLTKEQEKAIRAYRLLTAKPRMVVVNASDDEPDLERFAQSAPEGIRLVAVPVRLEVELSRMEPDDRVEFEEELGVTGSDRDALIHAMMDVSGQMIFFTAGDKEVRSWLLPLGGTALDAAAGVHSDLARGFIRAETMTVTDLVRLGSEREVKAQALVRQEPKDYVVQDDDVLLIRFSV